MNMDEKHSQCRDLIEDGDDNDDNDCPDDYDSVAEDRTMFKAKVVSNLSTFDRMEFFFFP